MDAPIRAMPVPAGGPGADSPAPNTPPGGSPEAWTAVEDDPLARRRDANVVWDVFLWIVLGFTALAGIIGIGAYLVGLFSGPPADVPTELSDEVVFFAQVIQWIAIVIGFAGFGLVPILWVAGTRQGGWAAVKPFFQLHRPAVNIALGLVGGIVMAGVLIGAFYVADLLGFEQPPNPLEDDLAAVLTWPMAIALALQAGITEEILFRGVIQRKLGWVWQAPIFGALHFAQGFLGFIITGLIGLLFGYLMHRKVSMWFLIAVHFSYDMVLLGLFLSGV